VDLDEGKGVSTKKQAYDLTSIINEVRGQVDVWRGLLASQWQGGEHKLSALSANQMRSRRRRLAAWQLGGLSGRATPRPPDATAGRTAGGFVESLRGD
jgi:hypothetical protein